MHKWNFLSISKERKEKINKKARKNRCKLFALEYINYKKITKLPINFEGLYDIFENFEWIILDYEEAKKCMNVSDPLNIKSRKCLARTFHERGSKVFLTVYVKNLKYPNRDYYTIAHELGHIILGHFIEFEETALARGGLTQKAYDVLEREADIFAAELIMPMPVLQKIKVKTYNDIVNICNVTKSSASIRLSEMKKYWIPDFIINIYNDTHLLFNDFINKKHCLQCNYGFISHNSKFCPICGHNKLIWGDGKMMYDSIELNELNKAKICPVCENENTNIEGDYCQICSTQIRNKCTKCGKILIGEARYCNYCNNESTFFKDNLLQDWQTLNSKDIVSYNYSDTIPDSEMPF